MKTKQQLIIDKYVAKPLAFFLNFIVRLLGLLLTIDHSLDKEFKKIAICKFKGMGSVIQATPMLEAIRRRFPDAEIIFVSSKSNKEILQKIHFINTIVIVDDSNFINFISSNIKSLIYLIRKRPDVYIDLEIYSDYSTLFTTFTISKNRIGFYLRSSSFRMGIYTHMMFFNPKVPISKVYLQIARLLNCNIDNVNLYDFSDKKSYPKFTSKKYIAINPNASDLRLERRWAKENFILLIKNILKEYPELNIILIGSKSEKTHTESIAEKFEDTKVLNTAGTTSLEELIHIIQHAKLVITNDTGPMHLAFCTKTPVISLFGPCSPEQYGTSEQSIVIYKNVFCSPCVHDFEVSPCKGDNVCMKLITVEEVFNKIEYALNTTLTEYPNQRNTVYIYQNNNNILGKVFR